MNVLACLIWVLLPAQGPPATVSGIVVDPSGTPMAGAEVWLADQPWWYGPKVLGQVKCDAEGRFSIARPEGAKGGGPSMPVALWAYAPGHRLGLLAMPADLPAPGEVARIEVGPPAKAVVRLESPDPSTPVKGKVEVFAVHRRPGSMPRALIERLGAPISEDGVATLDGFYPEDIQGLDVRTEALGTQTRNYNQPVPGDRTIRLRPVGHLTGKIVADDPSKLKGWKVTARTAPNDEPGHNSTVGNYWEDTDDQGRFDFPTLPTGGLTLRAQPPDGVAYVTDGVTGKVVKAGAALAVDIPVQRGVLVEGYVREVATGAPMPGVWISLFPKGHQGSGHSERTDEKGHYSKVLWPGQVTMHASGGPPTHLLPPKITGRTFEIPANVEKFELPAIEMSRGESIRGVVLDARGQPVANSAVEVRNPGDNAGNQNQARAMTRSNRSGEFLFQGMTPGAEFNLSAKKGGEATLEAVSAKAGAEAPVTLTLKPSDAIALKGRVLGPDGRPLANALVQLKSKVTGTGPPSWIESPVTLEGVEMIRTGADGVFETPRELASNLLYRAEAVADGMARAQTEWISPPSTGFPDLTLRRIRALRAVAGRVVDRAGEPVAGAVVFQSGDGPRPTRSVADREGRFRVDGVLDGRAFLFATADRFRFHAQPIGPGVGAVEIVLTRRLEQPAAWKPPDFPITREEEKALARELVEQARPRMRVGSDDRGDRSRLLALEARLDPDRAIELIQNQVVTADAVLANAALGLIEDDPRGALDLVESDRNDPGASQTYLTLFDALKSSDPALARELLARAERRARAIESSNAPGMMDQRVRPLCQVAERRLDLGERDRAMSLIREARAAVEATPARGGFSPIIDEVAKVLARVDLPAALALVDRDPAARMNNPGYYDNLLAGVAERAVDVDPAEAERLLGRIKQDYYGKDATRRACYRMASRDLERAKRLAAILGDKSLAPLLDALAARAKAATDPSAARALLDSAFAEFARLAEAPAGRASRSEIPAQMAMCLPVAERIDPSLVPEYLAKCLAARPNRTDEPGQEGVPPASMLSMFLSRYDWEAASIVFERVQEGLFAPSRSPIGLQGNAVTAILREAAVFDIRPTLVILDRLPEDPKGTIDTRFGEDRRKLEARLALAEALARPLARRRIEGAQINFRNWPIEQLD